MIGCGYCGEPIKRHLQLEAQKCLAELTKALDNRQKLGGENW